MEHFFKNFLNKIYDTVHSHKFLALLKICVNLAERKSLLPLIPILHDPPLNYTNSFTVRPSPRHVEHGYEIIS